MYYISTSIHAISLTTHLQQLIKSFFKSMYKFQEMKIFFKASCLFLIICFVLSFNDLSLPLLFFLSLVSLFPLFINMWLVPGGYAWRDSKLNPGKIPGPAGWPFLGILPKMGSHAHRKLAFMASSMDAKRLMAFSLGSTRVVITGHPETAKEILCGSAFSDRPVKESASLLMFERAIGFAPSGMYWRHLRRIASNHMFSPKRVSSLECVRQQVCNEMVEKVSKEMRERRIVELRGILQKGSLRNVMESVFGSGLGVEKEEELRVMVKEGYELIGEFHWGDYFPIRVLDFSGVRRRCHKLTLKVKSVVGQVIEERKRGVNNGQNDFLSILLSLPEEDQLTHADMLAVLWEMIFRGTDTVAILLEWIMARMVLHQDIQAKAQQEIDEHVGRHRHVQDSDIPNLGYVQAIVKEVLRLHPPGPLLSWARLATVDVHLGKFFVPAGTTAMVNMWAITHDSSIWKNPWEFKPERFMEDGLEDFPIMGSDLRLAPFGAGRRVCPGKSLGLATVQLWLARLLQRYKWLPASSTKVDLSERLKLSLELKTPMKCHVDVR